MRVDLVAYTSNPVDTIYMASKICEHRNAMDVMSEPLIASQEQKEEFIKTLIQTDNDFPLGHVTFTFLVENISFMGIHQLIQYPMVSHSQYIHSDKYADLEFRIPYPLCDQMNDNEEVKELVFNFLGQGVNFYLALIKLGIPPEYAKAFLPQTTISAVMFTMNGKEVRDFLKYQLGSDNQPELRMLAWNMLNKLNKVCPVLVADLKEKFSPNDYDSERWMSVVGVRF